MSRYDIKYKDPGTGETTLIDNKYNTIFRCPNYYLKNPNPYHLPIVKDTHGNQNIKTLNNYYITLQYADNSKIDYKHWLFSKLNFKYYKNIYEIDYNENNKVIQISINRYIYNTHFRAILYKKKYMDNIDSTVKFIGDKKKLDNGKEYIWIYELKGLYDKDSPNEYVYELRIVPMKKFKSSIYKIYNKYSGMIVAIENRLKSVRI